MMWLQPWAWLGLFGVALPVIIHLLGRGHARLHRFPTLRFLDVSRLLPTRRTRVHDLALLVVRCSAIAFAVAALAHPLVLTNARRRTLDRGLARAIIVDSSASMHRATSVGGLAIDSARGAARVLASGAQTSVIVESNDPTRAIAPAIRWLARQGRQSELVVISDFQFGQIDSSDFVVVPTGVGLTLKRIATVSPIGLERSGSTINGTVVARATLVGDRTDAEWVRGGGTPANNHVVLLASDADRNALNAARDAAATVATPGPIDSTRTVAIIFPTHARREELFAGAKPVDATWMVELLETMRDDSIPVSRYGVADVEGRHRLMVFVDANVGTITAVRAVADANRATSVAPPIGELEPATMSDAELTALERPPSNDVPTQLHPIDDNGPSDAGWFWVVALALLLVELPLRRARAAVTPMTTKERTRAA